MKSSSKLRHALLRIRDEAFVSIGDYDIWIDKDTPIEQFIDSVIQGEPAAPEIEVTEEMIEAALGYLYQYRPDESDGRETVKAILKAALATPARSKQQTQSAGSPVATSPSNEAVMVHKSESPTE